MTMNPEGPAKSLTQLVATEIKVQMARTDIRQTELARRMGVNDQWLSTRLRGKSPIDLNDLERIAGALGVPIVALLPARATATPADTLRKPHLTKKPRSGASPVADQPIRHERRPPSRPDRGSGPKPATRRPAMIPRPAL